ncbi:uncharacterized protein LOC120683789 isoform X1 [Panicum virgatum]|uniref:uncharacterized protein LOC120683789 isoform X1 n=1 Tax=Panicum virgatum TaxID=38727 RepID=UPI0019D5FEFA|nr:uncharacterized protein LOC120683789 isoform X1 [Panicum virgatum]
MGRSPCCEKEGLKKGPWTPEEDRKLLAYIEQHGHGCWRSLPAKAGELASILQHSATVIFVSLVTDVHAKNGRGRAAAVRQELPAPVDELPPAGHQAGQVQPAGGADHHPAPRAARQQVVGDRDAPAEAHRQRDQELLEHAPQEAAGQDGHRPGHAQAALRRARRGRRRRGRAARQGRRAPQPHGAVGERAARGRGAPGARGQAARARRVRLRLGAARAAGPLRRRARARVAHVHAELLRERGARLGTGGARCGGGRRARRHGAHAGVRGGVQGACAAAVGRSRGGPCRRRCLRRGGVHGAASPRRLEPAGPEAGRRQARRGRGRRAAGDGGGEELLGQHTEPGKLVVGVAADVSRGARARGVLVVSVVADVSRCVHAGGVLIVGVVDKVIRGARAQPVLAGAGAGVLTGGPSTCSPASSRANDTVNS